MNRHDQNGRVIYTQFKTGFRAEPGKPVLIGDILDISCPPGLKDKVVRIRVFPEGIKRPVKLSAVQIVDIITSEIGDAAINHMGNTNILLVPSKQQKENRLFAYIRLILAMILLFLGSALAIMYFHADVNMKEVHRLISRLINGDRAASPLLFSIPYSLGIGIGIGVFFNVFSGKDKKSRPGPLELELHQSKRELHDYLIDMEEQNKS
ncbi:MAG TPA: stage V sporulation protein AA [Candidatus Atribacteria bacterium]|nr:stage V sporulation protein AA [Candidatus Atribacteria bacterium]